MADQPNKDKDEFSIVDGADNTRTASVDGFGSLKTRIADAAGSLLLGQKTMADSIPTVIASDQTPIPITFSPSPDNKTIQLLYESISSQPVNANEWQSVLSYVVPSGFKLSPASFQASSSSSADLARAVRLLSLATYNSATNTFTDGSAYTTPQFAARMYCFVTTAIGSGSNDSITITYTNHEGTTGRTATATIPKSSPVGTRVEVTLQAGDIGVLDVTNITHTATGQAGAWTLEGTFTLFYLTLAVGNVQYDATGALNAFLIQSTQTVTMQYKTGSAAAKTRRINMVAPLIPES